MPYYEYKGLNKKKQFIRGKKKGSTERQVLEKLKEQDIVVKEIRTLEGVLYRDLPLFQKKVSIKDFVLFLRQFSTLLKAGIPLVEATSTLAQQASKKTFRSVLLDVEEELRSGKSFSAATEKHTAVFSSLFINMVKAGEASGRLDDILERLASYYEKHYETRRKVISALSYPAVIGSVAIIVVIFLLSFVVPTFASIYESFDSELPTITVLVLHAGDVIGKWWWMIPLFVIGSIAAVNWARINYRSFRYYMDYAMLKLPVFGKLIQKAVIARMTRTLSSLFESSVPIIQSISIVERVVANEVVAATLRQSRSALERGESISGPMQEQWVFPPMVTQMIAVGETTGSLDLMLTKVADYYESEVDAATDQIKALIEPILILFLAVAVGTIVAAIAVPMFDMFNSIQ